MYRWILKGLAQKLINGESDKYVTKIVLKTSQGPGSCIVPAHRLRIEKRDYDYIITLQHKDGTDLMETNIGPIDFDYGATATIAFDEPTIFIDCKLT